MPGTRKLGRTSDHRTAMLRAMVTFLLENGRIETTVTRAKEVRSMTEKYITLAKENNIHNKRQALAFITKEDVVKKLFDEIAPKYADVNGGYCRIIKTGPRRGDAAEMAIIELKSFSLNFSGHIVICGGNNRCIGADNVSTKTRKKLKTFGVAPRRS